MKDGSMLVCMVSKPKRTAAAAATTSTTTTAASSSPATTSTTPAPVPAPSSTAMDTSDSTSGDTSNAGGGSSETPAAASNPAPPTTPFSGPDFDAKVSQLKDMGFPEEECRAALRAAFGDSNRAVEFLMTGIPSEAAAAAAAAPSPMDTSGGESTTAAAAAPSTSSGGGPLDALRQHPHFNQLRQVARNNPGALHQLLPELCAGNQELLNAITENQAEFVAMMNEPIEENATSAAPPASSNAPASSSPNPLAALGAALGGAGANPEQLAQILQLIDSMPPEQAAQIAQAINVSPEDFQAITQRLSAGMMRGGAAGGMPSNVVTLTQEEDAAVNRLTELGFPKQACLEAYLACDKDEQVAANYLFTNPPEPDSGDNNESSS